MGFNQNPLMHLNTLMVRVLLGSVDYLPILFPTISDEFSSSLHVNGYTSYNVRRYIMQSVGLRLSVSWRSKGDDPGKTRTVAIPFQAKSFRFRAGISAPTIPTKLAGRFTSVDMPYHYLNEFFCSPGYIFYSKRGLVLTHSESKECRIQ